jgi:hypothetical protein
MKKSASSTPKLFLRKENIRILISRELKVIIGRGWPTLTEETAIAPTATGCD